MRIAKRNDRKQVVAIITETFQNNPGVNWMISSRGNQARKIRRLADYAFIKCYNRGGILISSNEKGVALFYKNDKRMFSLLELYYEVRFGLFSIRFNKILEVLRRESYRKSKRPKKETYYYFWFLGVLKDGANAGFELNKELINIARKENTPIYLETTLERNKKIYERIGYVTFDSWKDDSKRIKFWFLKWENK